MTPKCKELVEHFKTRALKNSNLKELPIEILEKIMGKVKNPSLLFSSQLPRTEEAKRPCDEAENDRLFEERFKMMMEASSAPGGYESGEYEERADYHSPGWD